MAAHYEKLIEGYHNFFHQSFKDQKAHFHKLATQGQNPEVMIISCADSRVDPLSITQAQPGDIFTIRNVANLVPEYELDRVKQCLSTESALKYSVLHLHVKHIIVMGHSHCGGIKALIDMDQSQENRCEAIHEWVGQMDSAKQDLLGLYPNSSEKEIASMCERHSLLYSLKNLLSYPYVLQLVNEKKLQLHAWHFDIKSGKIEEYKQRTGKFELLI